MKLNDCDCANNLYSPDRWDGDYENHMADSTVGTTSLEKAADKDYNARGPIDAQSQGRIAPPTTARASHVDARTVRTGNPGTIQGDVSPKAG